MTTIVRITVATNAEDDAVAVPDVVGLRQGAARARLQRAGFSVSVVLDEECDPADETCDSRPGMVWAQSPSAGVEADVGRTVTIVVNP
jgi:beta-lactam-binding protein with PASTA domain